MVLFASHRRPLRSSPGIPLKRFVILTSAVVMQMCLGATYSWSVYVGRLREITGLTQGLVQLPFTIFYLAFPATMIVAGALLTRIGPRRSAVIGGVLFGSGWLIASLGTHGFGFTILGIGLVAGIGVGFAYIVPIAVGVQWFPRQKGLVTGIAVAGFGGGAALISFLGGSMMRAWSWTPFATFRLFGAVFLLLVTASALAMTFPAPAAGTHRPTTRSRDILRRREFALLYGAMFTGLAAGFAVNANLREFGFIHPVETGVLAVSLFAVANAAGRITWGFLFDRFPGIDILRANLLCQSATLAAGGWLIASGGGFLLFAVLAGFNYGGVLVLYASSAARIWGAERVGQVYGLLFSANIVAAPAPLAAGILYDAFGSFDLSRWLLAFVIIAAVIQLSMNTTLFRTAESSAHPTPPQ